MGIKERVTARVVDLFSHSERPLQNTEKYDGDPGLFGPGSISCLLYTSPSPRDRG